MPQTISELEKDRAALLEEIEAQAQNISAKKPSKEHNLKDWLNAAEEVMPAQKISSQKVTPQSSPPVRKKDKSSRPSKASFFGVIIVLSLMLTILGVLYIAYTSTDNKLKEVLEASEASQQEVVAIKKVVVTLEKEISLLKEPLSQYPAKTTPGGVGASEAPEAIVDLKNMVTSKELERKFDVYIQKINIKLDKIMQHLDIEPANKESSAQKISDNVALTVPQELKVQHPSIKSIDQPVVRLVERVKPAVTEPIIPIKPIETIEPVSPKPVIQKSPDVNWLIKEPAVNFTMQLASMPNRAGIAKIKSDNSLKNAKIIPQDRNGKIQYVLVLGSFTNRESANNAARDIQSKHKISPWVRPISHLISRVP